VIQADWLLGINSGYKETKALFTVVWFPIQDGAYRHHIYSRFVVHYEDTIHRVSQESCCTYTAFIGIIPHTEFLCVLTKKTGHIHPSLQEWRGGACLIFVVT